MSAGRSAGDQLIVDFDLSVANAPAGTRLRIGSAVIEVTDKPHTGCAKFAERFGVEAARWVNSRKDLRLRGICAVVVEPGAVSVGDEISRLCERRSSVDRLARAHEVGWLRRA